MANIAQMIQRVKMSPSQRIMAIRLKNFIVTMMTQKKNTKN